MKNNKKYRVLLFGYNQTNFLLPIYRYIVSRNNNPYQFYAYNLNFIGSKDDIITKYITILDDRFRKSKKGIIKSIVKAWWNPLFYQNLQEAFRNLNKTIFREYLKKWALKGNYREAFQNFDIVHIHFCHPYFMQYVQDLPKDKVLICSIWGSDILKRDNERQIREQSLAFERANVITIQTEELCSFFLNKYGQHLKPKIEIIQFGIPHTKLLAIDKLARNTSKFQQYLSELNLSSTKYRIVIGSNRSKNNNHLQIAEEICKLPNDIASKLQVIVPFGYGTIDRAYKNEIIQIFENNSIDYIFIDEYLYHERLATLRLAAHVYIHLPQSDALSATLAEFLYAGAICITGDWLPYHYFEKRSNSDQLIQIPRVQELSITLQKVANAGFRQHPINKKLASISENLTSPQWGDLYDRCIQHKL